MAFLSAAQAQLTKEQAALDEQLCQLAFAGDAEIDRINELLAEGANVNGWRDDNGYTALIAACWPAKAAPETVTALLKKGADAAAKRMDGRTALFFAASGGHLEVCRQLVASGGPDLVNMRDEKGQTAKVFCTRNASGEHGHTREEQKCLAWLTLQENTGSDILAAVQRDEPTTGS